MRLNKVKKVVRKKLCEYPLFYKDIEELENKKSLSISKDENSFIRSKNKVNRAVETEAIRNIEIANKISEIKEWQNIIETVFEEFKEDHIKSNVVEYKFIGNLSEDSICDRLCISKGCIRNYIFEFIYEIGILAIIKGLITFK